MTINQEDALYDFLENAIDPFTIEEAAAFIRMIDSRSQRRLPAEIGAFLNTRNLAFRFDGRHWLSRRGCFESARFVIKPSRLEILNGILIPGHRCIPFANPILLPQEYSFYWRGAPIPMASSEAAPEEFYPYYTIFGEEYAPQYVARDNPENEEAFNQDPYEDPPEVSIHTLDMRSIYRESGFVPGDCFAVGTRDWKGGCFDLERIAGDQWSGEALEDWMETAEKAFQQSFSAIGPGSSTEEQIAYAYWFGGERMRDIPAYSLEEFLYERTERIETVPYGIETRFWFSGEEIPDQKNLERSRALPDKTILEDILHKKGVPVSEYVVQSFVRDAFYRNEPDIPGIIDRIVPPSIPFKGKERDYLAHYVADVQDEFYKSYSPFADKAMGPVRQRVGELHTVVVDLVARLKKGDIDESWLPKHTFVILSQIQEHAASIMEDLDVDDEPPSQELEAMDNSMDSMIETYEDIRDMIDEALDSFRRIKLSVVRKDRGKSPQLSWRVIQASLKGTNVWRRVLVPESADLDTIHRVLQILFQWKGSFSYTFTGRNTQGHPDWTEDFPPDQSLRSLADEGILEFNYEYGPHWAVKIMFLSPPEEYREARISCTAGAGAPPPEKLAGALRFRRFITALEREDGPERQRALNELGLGFDPDYFDIEGYNRELAALDISGKIE